MRPSTVELDQNGLEVLSSADCLALLAIGSLGRVAITSRALPSVLPVQYWLQGDGIIFLRTSPNSVLSEAMRDAVVAFEVDDGGLVVPATWSVHLIGRTQESNDHAAWPLTVWSGPAFTIMPGQISGRRFVD